MNNKYVIDWDEYAKTARLAAAEGAVLLKNENKVLPLKKGDKISIFGRSQFNYYKSGTGSGGLVNTKYVVSILDALCNEEALTVNEELKRTYSDWIVDHPFDMGNGWAMEPWSQEEMPLTDEIVKAARRFSNKAIIILGRTAGEDKDAKAEAGSYLLSELEHHMLKMVTKAFDEVIVLLNVGSIIDMKWVDEYKPSAVMYVWQGGIEGGNAVCDLVMGRVNPSGRLTDTIAYDINDYKSTENFGSDELNYYVEDIFVGYRYFETFMPERVMYPFGYGLSYTSFERDSSAVSYSNNKLDISYTVRNTGELAGKEVVQFYVKAPQGKLGKAKRSLIGFRKTSLLKPNESESLTLSINDEMFASYDDSGVTGYRFSYVLEAGEYEIYGGSNVRTAEKIGAFNLRRDVVIKKCQSALAPVKAFKRIKPKPMGRGSYTVDLEQVPLRSYDLNARIKADEYTEYEYTGDFDYKLSDVYDHKVSMGTFLSQLSDEDLRCMVRGEGMCSARVTPGTASAFGGVTDRLEHFGIPAGCCSDGPSGIRMDCGTYAFAMPNGTCLACTFDVDLNEKLYDFEGKELRKNRIDTLLGPGMNIHRNPLNGRNFEYFSEDPLVTGLIAAAQLRGMAKYQVTGTIKHFACNNQEHNRRSTDAVVSERALREIYLKGFEIAVKAKDAYLIMTSYGAINGIFTAGNYDLNTRLLREEWGFEGMVMTDWWATINDEGKEALGSNLAAMVRSGNDVYMVIKDALLNEYKDNLKGQMEAGKLTRGQLQKCATNILHVLMRSAVMDRSLNRISDEEKEAIALLPKEDQDALELAFIPMDTELEIDPATIDTQMGKTTLIGVESSHIGKYVIELEVTVDALELAQVPVTFYANGILFGTQTFNGTDNKRIIIRQDLGIFGNKNAYIKLYFGQSGMIIHRAKIRLAEELKGTIWEG